MDKALRLMTAVVLVGVPCGTGQAITTIPSANGNGWDILDSTDITDSGAVGDGDQDAFDGWGSLKIQVFDESFTPLVSNTPVADIDLTSDGGRRWSTITPQVGGGVTVSRALYAPLSTDYLRYIDTFTNITGAQRFVQVVLGGGLGSDSATTLAANSSNDGFIAANDTWALTIESTGFVPTGPATDPPVGYVFRNDCDANFLAVSEFTGGPFSIAWPGNGNDDLGFVYQFALEPGESLSIAFFLYRGLEENATGPLGQMPTTGTEIALAQTVLANLAQNPDFGDLTPADRGQIINWCQYSLTSNNGNPWDVSGPGSITKDGSINDGGQDAFDTFGGLHLHVEDGSAGILTADQELTGFRFVSDGAGGLISSAMPVTVSGVAVDRSLRTPPGTDFLRYIDTFTNTTGETRRVGVAWGGNLGSDGNTTLASTSSGDLAIAKGDTWAVTIQNASNDPAGPAGDPPVGYGIGDSCDPPFSGARLATDPFMTLWPGNGEQNLAFVYEFTLAPGASAKLAYFLYRGLAEGAEGPELCDTPGHPACQTPATGSEIAKANAALAALDTNPIFGDLDAATRNAILNYPTCDDLNACTTDNCDPVAGCSHTDISGTCNDNDVCTVDSCSPASGCVNAPRPGFENVTCAFERSIAPDPCAGQTIPAGIGKKFAKAGTLAGQAGSASGKKQKKLLKSASKLLKKDLKLVDKSARKKKNPLSAACADALRFVVGDAKTRVDAATP